MCKFCFETCHRGHDTAYIGASNPDLTDQTKVLDLYSGTTWSVLKKCYLYTDGGSQELKEYKIDEEEEENEGNPEDAQEDEGSPEDAQDKEGSSENAQDEEEDIWNYDWSNLD